jgi:hypothetical protein
MIAILRRAIWNLVLEVFGAALRRNIAPHLACSAALPLGQRVSGRVRLISRQR